MNWTRIRYLIFKELKGIVRDRRTFITMVIMPLVFLPLLLGGITYFQMMAQQQSYEEITYIFIEGGEKAPGLVGYLKGEEGIRGATYLGRDPEEALKEGLISLYLRVEDDFQDNINEGKTGQITVFYNNTRERSQAGLDRFEKLVMRYQKQIVKKTAQ
ncbi:hypothetical protein [Halothermothrix orenii]|uniref:ABC-2 type transporter n=1 Tax=Halothermothrix orenii (strain H 168 / OCM 544 / DSM 9562) TaxID=373903 RepID=B8CZK0_HALOH|nr:hypothetical protein [Halothermothrix orenii]ACL70719.1 hypothetical protein Hore_19720 [Halothermothrix orenii H 168]